MGRSQPSTLFTAERWRRYESVVNCQLRNDQYRPNITGLQVAYRLLLHAGIPRHVWGQGVKYFNFLESRSF